MSEATADAQAPAPIPPDRLDNILNIVLGVLAAAVLVVGGLFAYNVWSVRQAAITATPALRLIEDIKDDVRANPNDATLRVRLGEAYAAAGKYDEAMEQFQNALKIDPEHTGAYLDMGVVSTVEGDFDAAISAFEKVVELTEGSEFQSVNDRREVALYNLGVIALDRDQFEDAIGYLKGALRIRRDASDTYYHLARAYEGLEEFDAAIEQLEIAIAFDPNYAQAHYLMWQVYTEMDDEINASYHAQIAASLAPDADPPAEALAAYGTAAERMARGEEALESGEIEEALKQALIARNIEPENVEAVLFHGRVLERRGDNTDAVTVYNEALELDAENEEAKAAIERLQGS